MKYIKNINSINIIRILMLIITFYIGRKDIPLAITFIYLVTLLILVVIDLLNVFYYNAPILGFNLNKISNTKFYYDIDTDQNEVIIYENCLLFYNIVNRKKILTTDTPEDIIKYIDTYSNDLNKKYPNVLLIKQELKNFKF